MAHNFSTTVQLLFRGLIDFLCPPSCIYCGSNVKSGQELCHDCYQKYAAEAAQICPICEKTALECECCEEFSRFTKTVINNRRHISLFFYNGAKRAENMGRISEDMLLQLKSSGKFSGFFANELAVEIRRAARISGIDLGEWTVTYIPRSVANFEKYGVDQGEEVAERLARKLDIPMKKTFVRADGAAQKELDAKSRLTNAELTIVPRKAAIEKGAKYILFDDVITTGSSVQACARHLYFCGADAVFPISIAKTLPIKQKYNATNNK